VSAEEWRQIPSEHTWKPPAFKEHLPELLEKARFDIQLFKVWKGDIPRCEIETKGSVRRARGRVGLDDAEREVWEFRLEHRAGTDFWPVLDALVQVLGPPILLTTSDKVPVYYAASGDPDRPFAELWAYWPASTETTPTAL
jgi:hypothetical protein